MAGSTGHDNRGEPSPEASGQWPVRAQTPHSTLHRPRRCGPRGTVDGEREERGQRGPAPLPGSWGRARPKADPRKRGGQEGGRQAAVLASRAEQERGVHAGRSRGEGRESAPREPLGRGRAAFFSMQRAWRSASSRAWSPAAPSRGLQLPSLPWGWGLVTKVPVGLWSGEHGGRFSSESSPRARPASGPAQGGMSRGAVSPPGLLIWKELERPFC